MNNQNRQVLLMVIHLMKLFKILPFNKLYHYTINIILISIYHSFAKEELYLKANPIIEIRKTAEALNVSYNTVSKVVKRFIDIGILVQMSEHNRNRTFSYEAYLKILRKGT